MTQQLSHSLVSKEVNDFVDKVEYHMVNDMVDSGEFEVIDCPVKHTFLYAREITMPAGSRVTSKIHKTKHYFEVTKGTVTVRTFVGGNFSDVVIKAPYRGVTEPGTRRVLLIGDESDCVWTTFHKIDEGEKLEEIEDRIIEKHINNLIGHV